MVDNPIYLPYQVVSERIARWAICISLNLSALHLDLARLPRALTIKTESMPTEGAQEARTLRRPKKASNMLDTVSQLLSQ